MRRTIGFLAQIIYHPPRLVARALTEGCLQSVADKLAKSESNNYDDDDGREDLPWAGSDAGGGAGGAGAGGAGGNGKQMCLRLPELIDTLAKEGQVLRWDECQRLYEVRTRTACPCDPALPQLSPPPPPPSSSAYAQIIAG